MAARVVGGSQRVAAIISSRFAPPRRFSRSISRLRLVTRGALAGSGVTSEAVLFHFLLFGDDRRAAGTGDGGADQRVAVLALGRLLRDGLFGGEAFLDELLDHLLCGRTETRPCEGRQRGHDKRGLGPDQWLHRATRRTRGGVGGTRRSLSQSKTKFSILVGALGKSVVWQKLQRALFREMLILRSSHHTSSASTFWSERPRRELGCGGESRGPPSWTYLRLDFRANSSLALRKLCINLWHGVFQLDTAPP